MATRSAVRAGWFTGGVRFQIAEPTWMRFVRAAIHGSTISEADRCEYSSRKWCSTDHTYLKLCRSHSSASSTSAMSFVCSAPAGSASTSRLGTWAWMKSPNSIVVGRLYDPCGASVKRRGMFSVEPGDSACAWHHCDGLTIFASDSLDSDGVGWDNARPPPCAARRGVG